MADIFNDLERIIAEERREEFLRLARDLRDYGRDNPELLRRIEAIGLTSFYRRQALQAQMWPLVVVIPHEFFQVAPA